MIKITLIPVYFTLDIVLRTSYDEMKKYYGEPLNQETDHAYGILPIKYYLFSEEEALYFKLKYNNLISRIIELDD